MLLVQAVLAVGLIAVIAGILLFVKVRCPKCDGTMVKVGEHNGMIVYECKSCGTRWV